VGVPQFLFRCWAGQWKFIAGDLINFMRTSGFQAGIRGIGSVCHNVISINELSRFRLCGLFRLFYGTVINRCQEILFSHGVTR
jgi:hypothetical protein